MPLKQLKKNRFVSDKCKNLFLYFVLIYVNMLHRVLKIYMHKQINENNADQNYDYQNFTRIQIQLHI